MGQASCFRVGWNTLIFLLDQTQISKTIFLSFSWHCIQDELKIEFFSHLMLRWTYLDQSNIYMTHSSFNFLSSLQGTPYILERCRFGQDHLLWQCFRGREKLPQNDPSFAQKPFLQHISYFKSFHAINKLQSSF